MGWKLCRSRQCVRSFDGQRLCLSTAPNYLTFGGALGRTIMFREENRDCRLRIATLRSQGEREREGESKFLTEEARKTKQGGEAGKVD